MRRHGCWGKPSIKACVQRLHHDALRVAVVGAFSSVNQVTGIAVKLDQS
jgi:hypothetical protein